jgi:outer membrane receptor for ferric coprogen and ferric-rhodotorulic acid
LILRFRNLTRILAFPVLAVAILLTPLPCAAQSSSFEAGSEARDFAIPAQQLSDSVLTFSEQADVQLVQGADVTAGLFASAVAGRMSIAAALDRLISGTNLTWRYVGPRTITIERKAVAVSPETGAPSAATRVFAPIRIESSRETRSLSANGSTDTSATEGAGIAATTSRAASKVPQSLIDTPRSVSVLTADRLDQSGLDDISEALREMPGVAARMVDGITGYSFLSRGFEVTTFTFDGGGPTFYQSSLDSDVRTLLDTPELAEFDHIELLRGATGPYGGLSDPSGVINLQRKRPLDHQRLAIDIQTGSWNHRRIEMDASTPVAFDGHLRMRIVGISQDRDFFYSTTHEDRAFIYGTMEADIGSRLLVRFGGSYRDLRRPGLNASGLPRYIDGGDLRLPRSTCLCLASNYYGAQQREQFGAVEWQIGGSWQVTASATRRTQMARYSDALLITLAERDGSYENYPFKSANEGDLNQTTADLVATGDVVLGSFRLKVTAGFDYAFSHSLTSGRAQSYSPIEGLTPIAALPLLGERDVLGEPDDQSTFADQGIHVRQFGPYLNLSLRPLKGVTLQIGARKSFYQIDSTPTNGLIFTSLSNRTSGPITPIVALSYEPNPRVRLYATYSRIFRIESVHDDFDTEVAPVSGDAFEVGVKWQTGSAGPLLSVSTYYLPVFGLTVQQLDLNEMDVCCTYRIPRAYSYGIDLEMTGTIRKRWQVQASYNWNRNAYRFENAILAWRSQQPEYQVKLWTTYTIPQGSGQWQAGGGVRLESARYSNGEVCGDRVNPTIYCLGANSRPFLYPTRFAQPLYAVADLRLARRFASGIELALHVNNVTDARYYATTAAPAFGNYYGEPRSYLLSFKVVVERGNR